MSLIHTLIYSDGPAKESEIRTAIGDDPNTSKALRRMVANRIVIKCGKGGKGDPFVYSLVYNRTNPLRGESNLTQLSSLCTHAEVSPA